MGEVATHHASGNDPAASRLPASGVEFRARKQNPAACNELKC